MGPIKYDKVWCNVIFLNKVTLILLCYVQNRVHAPYLAVIFLQMAQNKKNPIACPWGWDMGCFESDQSLNLAVVILSAKLYFIGQFVFYTSSFNKVERGYTGFTLSVCTSVRLWTESRALSIFNNTCLIHFVFTHLIKQLQKVCCM